MSGAAGPTVLIVPGLRDAAEEHWQSLLAKKLPRVREVPPMGRDDLDCSKRVAAIEREAASIEGPLVIVAHSGGVITVAHWARRTLRAVRGALLAVPPDFEKTMPAGYPTVQALDAAGWLPVPQSPLPFPSIVAASRNDPLCGFHRACTMALNWKSRIVDLGQVGHLNPASGFGEWPQAEELVLELCAIRSSEPMVNA
jgi:predicted alpha/beta hydrolase family esterase